MLKDIVAYRDLTSIRLTEQIPIKSRMILTDLALSVAIKSTSTDVIRVTLSRLPILIVPFPPRDHRFPSNQILSAG